MRGEFDECNGEVPSIEEECERGFGSSGLPDDPIAEMEAAERARMDAHFGYDRPFDGIDLMELEAAHLTDEQIVAGYDRLAAALRAMAIINRPRVVGFQDGGNNAA